jgi:hypothetical protein
MSYKINGKDIFGDIQLTGIPRAPTAATTENTTQIATTAFVKNQGYATLSGPALTGVPTAPTATTSDSSTQIATTAFVKNQGYGNFTANQALNTNSSVQFYNMYDNKIGFTSSAWNVYCPGAGTFYAGGQVNGLYMGVFSQNSDPNTSGATILIILNNVNGGSGPIWSWDGNQGNTGIYVTSNNNPTVSTGYNIGGGWFRGIRIASF